MRLQHTIDQCEKSITYLLPYLLRHAGNPLIVWNMMVDVAYSFDRASSLSVYRVKVADYLLAIHGMIYTNIHGRPLYSSLPIHNHIKHRAVFQVSSYFASPLYT